jgi:hypothetical protein
MTFLLKESFSSNRDPKGNSYILIDMMTTQPVISQFVELLPTVFR